MFKTGGGIFIPKLTVFDGKVLSLLKDNYFSIENKFDSNVTSESFVSTSPLPMTSSETENIFIMYENDNNLEDEAQEIVTTVEDNSNNQVIDIYEPIRNVPNRKKVKLTKSIISKDFNSDIKGKKIEILDKKMSILNKIEESEMENVKGKKLDNEIKEIVKQREMLQLEIQRKELEKLCKET